MTSKKDTTDHYRVLELPHDCAQKEISASYKRLALLHHPDKTGDDEFVSDHFHQIQEAGEVLRDPKRRRLYDKTLSLQLTSDFHGYHKRSEPYGFPRSRNGRETTEEESDTPWNSKPPSEEYKYTWGSSVHMNLESDWAQAEIARRAKEMDEWEMRYAGVDPEVLKAENEYNRKLSQGQVSPEGEAMINEEAGEDDGPGPSSWKQTKEVNGDGRDHGYIDPDVQKSNERLYAYGMKGGVPSDDEDSLPKGASASEDTENLWWETQERDGLWKTKFEDSLYDAESEAGSENYSATSNAGPLIDLSDGEHDFEASPQPSKEDEAEPADTSKPATNKDNPPKDTEMANVIAADEKEAGSITGSLGCFIDLSDDEQDYEASPDCSGEHKVEAPDSSKLAIDKNDLFKDAKMPGTSSTYEQGDTGSNTGSIGYFIALSDDEQYYKAIKRKQFLGVNNVPPS